MRRVATAVFIFLAILGTEARGQSISIFTPQGGKIAISSTEGYITSRDFLGRHVFLVFGFTTCPDICPLTLHTLRQVAESLGKEERESFRFLFVSIDPEKDSIDRLKSLKSVYGPQFIGATDSHERLKKLTHQFGAFFRVFMTKEGKRIVSHTDSIFHINREGEWVGTLPFGSSKQTILEELRRGKKRQTGFVDAETTAQLVGENKNCDLSNEECTIQIREETFRLKMEPKPIRAEREFSIQLKTDSKRLTPMEVDFEGVLINMGYLRPKLNQITSGEYGAQSTLPICELDKMGWKVKIFLKDQRGRLQAIQYHLTTSD